MILIVEDEPSVRWLMSEVLAGCGYRVLEASSGVETLRICEDPELRIDLIMIDVILPDTDGIRLGGSVATLQPSARVLYISGFLGQAVMPAGAPFLPKPFRPNVLCAKVREVLGNNGE
jgi:DNA-binding response OmpR family regulator